jgi:hypothetical protein
MPKLTSIAIFLVLMVAGPAGAASVGNFDDPEYYNATMPGDVDVFGHSTDFPLPAHHIVSGLWIETKCDLCNQRIYYWEWESGSILESPAVLDVPSACYEGIMAKVINLPTLTVCPECWKEHKADFKTVIDDTIDVLRASRAKLIKQHDQETYEYHAKGYRDRIKELEGHIADTEERLKELKEQAE